MVQKRAVIGTSLNTSIVRNENTINRGGDETKTLKHTNKKKEEKKI